MQPLGPSLAGNIMPSLNLAACWLIPQWVPILRTRFLRFPSRLSRSRPWPKSRDCCKIRSTAPRNQFLSIPDDWFRIDPSLLDPALLTAEMITPNLGGQNVLQLQALFAAGFAVYPGAPPAPGFMWNNNTAEPSQDSNDSGQDTSRQVVFPAIAPAYWA
ncbi:hypothetical protein SCP_0804780 [Sparassis crispa]|uniref:Uncharacterized protein n=1 Tax=Sparassis crispa TaxID=139825 RepID=A0A401GW14_9APHY|nr:hypothetical protein SCP_0804780 [Sparassis crispa]GBE85954.1 hypothetical protein SCP_0804780 [Sparassis crispa]